MKAQFSGRTIISQSRLIFITNSKTMVTTWFPTEKIQPVSKTVSGEIVRSENRELVREIWRFPNNQYETRTRVLK